RQMSRVEANDVLRCGRGRDRVRDVGRVADRVGELLAEDRLFVPQDLARRLACATRYRQHGYDPLVPRQVLITVGATEEPNAEHDGDDDGNDAECDGDSGPGWIHP